MSIGHVLELVFSDPEEIEEDLQEILEELGYGSRPSGISPPSGGFVPVTALEVFLVMIVVVILLYFAFLMVNRSVISVREPTSERKKELEMIEKKDYSAFYKKAVFLGKKGRYSEAIRTLYMALLVLLDSKEIIAYHPSLTNFEYRQKVRPYPFNLFFERITRIFDVIFYGRGKATGKDFSQVMDAFTQIEEAES